MKSLYVINKSDTPHYDRWNGQDYIFEPKVPVELPIDAARLFFGYGELDKREALVRQGWIKSANDYTDAVRKLEAFAFATRELAPPTLEDLEAEAAAPARGRPKAQ